MQMDDSIKNSVPDVKISDIAKYKDVNDTMKTIENSAFGKSMKNVKPSEQAKSIDEIVKSKNFRESIKENKKFILDNYEIAGKKAKDVVNTQLQNTVEVQSQPSSNEQFYIVISSSMPKEQIREYFKAVEGKQHVTFVLRGLIGDPTKFIPTKNYLESLVKKYPLDENNQEAFNIALEINPKVTRKYKIDKVPAFIYVPDYDGQLEKNEAIDKDKESDYYVAYGLVSLEYVIKEINKEAHSKWLNELLKKDTFFNSNKKEG